MYVVGILKRGERMQWTSMGELSPGEKERAWYMAMMVGSGVCNRFAVLTRSVRLLYDSARR